MHFYILTSSIILTRVGCLLAFSALQKQKVTSVCFESSKGINSHRNQRFQIFSESPLRNSEDLVTSLCNRVEILDQGELHAVINKPASVKCHHSDWTGNTDEIPMLQRIRDTMNQRVV